MSVSERTVGLLKRARELLMNEKKRYPKTIKALDYVLTMVGIKTKKYMTIVKSDGCDQETVRTVENSDVRYFLKEKGNWYRVEYYNSDDSDGYVEVFANSHLDAVGLFNVWAKDRNIKFIMVCKE
jgi:hypothetical protein